MALHCSRQRANDLLRRLAACPQRMHCKEVKCRCMGWLQMILRRVSAHNDSGHDVDLAGHLDHQALHLALRLRVSNAQVESTPQVQMLGAQVSLQERRLPDAELSIKAAAQQCLQQWWALPVPGAANQVCAA